MKYLLICSHCGKKHYTDGDVSEIPEVRNSAPLHNKKGEEIKLAKKFRCDQCGYLFKVVRTEEKKEEIKERERPELPDDETYLKQWENEVLKSVRNRKPKA